MSEAKTDTQSAIDAGVIIGQEAPMEVRGVPVLIVPEGATVHKLEDLLLNPQRARGLTTLTDVSSFIVYVNDRKTPETRIYCVGGKSPSLTAIFNDHSSSASTVPAGGEAGHRDDKAVYPMPLSAEWLAWNFADGKPVEQALFAQFIEDNLPDILGGPLDPTRPDVLWPSQADMVEISRELVAKKKVDFSSRVNLVNGTNTLSYDEVIDSSTSNKGQLQIPEAFAIAIPVFEGGTPWKLTARLRFAISDDKKLRMWFKLDRPLKTIEKALQDVKEKVAKETDLVVLAGSV